jgi:hypothetical protein
VQFRHPSAEPSSSRYAPAGHATHTTAPDPRLYVPIRQARHSPTVACPEYLPAGHCVQLFAPGPENAPGWQPSHDDAPSPEENRPATHGRHATACSSGENSPGGHSAHDEARASAYAPAPQAVQAEAPNHEDVPSGHAWQPRLAGWAEYRPGVQLVHSSSCVHPGRQPR